jgi:hypothetical protein
MESRNRFLRALLLFVLLATVAFGLEFFIEWLRHGRPSFVDMSWGEANPAKLIEVLSPMTRSYNNILAMLIATIGLAIPLTANMHTPKLIEMFLRDRTNQVMLTLGALGAANALWVQYLTGPHFAPIWACRVAALGAVLGWVCVVPYFFYVIRFVDPSNILDRLKTHIMQEIRRVLAGRISAAASHTLVHQRLHQIGTIILKSIDRADRGVAVEGIWSLKQLLDYYGQRKAKMPKAWFQAERKDFIGLSPEAIQIINADHTWFEHKVLTQMSLAYQSALSKTQDEVSAISDATRVMADHAMQRGDDRALELAVKFFNNYLREAIKKKESHAVYDIFYQYRQLACDVRDRADMLRDIGRRFRYYCDYAVAYGLTYVPLLAGFDLSWLVRQAYDCQSKAADELLDNLLWISHRSGSTFQVLPVKAKLIIGGYFQRTGHEAEAERVRQNLADVPPATLTQAEQDLLTLTDPSFWEVTDRQVNFDWVPPEERPGVAAFIGSLRRQAAGAPR